MKNAQSSKGWTLIELAIVLSVSAILAAGVVSVFIPQIMSYLHAVSDTTLQTVTADVVKIIFEGDHAARGLRFADPKSPITAASANSITYQYYDLYQLGSETPHTVTITHDAANRVVSRIIDGGSVEYVPRYAKPGNGFLIDALEGDFFQYYDSSGMQLTGAIDLNNIARVNSAVEVSDGKDVMMGGAKHRLKTGVFIKRNA